MLQAPRLSSSITYIPQKRDYLPAFHTLKIKVCRLGKTIFDYLAAHQYALSVVVWTSLFIQVGTTASAMSVMDPIDNLETCIDTFCAYSNKTHPDYYLFSREICWNRELSEHQPFSSLEECMSYLNSLYSSYIDTNWNIACPTTHLKSTVKKVNKYMAQCFNRLCSGENPITFIDKNSFDWCSLKEVKRSRKALKALTEQVTHRKTNRWTREDILQVSVDIFFDLNKKTQSMLASITSAERFGTLTSNIQQDLYLIKKGLKEMLSSPIELIKGIVHDESGKGLSPQVQKSLLKIVEKIEKSLPSE